MVLDHRPSEMGCKKVLGFFVVVMLIPRVSTVGVEVAPTESQAPDVFVRLTFNVAWTRFCYLGPLFKHRLSDILIEERDGLVFLIPTSRIKIIHFDEECKYKHGNVKKAVVDFYISTPVSAANVDRKYTELAFSILFHFWEAKRMVLLGPTFEHMVDKVEIRGKEAHTFPKKLNEGERIGIGIAVGLVVVFAVALLYFMLYYRGKSYNTERKLKDTGRGIPRRESLASKVTEDIILDDGLEGSSGTEMLTESCEEPLSRPEEEPEEEELNVYVTKC